MNILYIHHQLPYPFFAAIDKGRYNIIKILKLKHNITLIVPINASTRREDIAKVREICTELVTVPVNARNFSSLSGKYIYKWYQFIMLRIPMYAITNYHSRLNDVITDLCKSNQYDIIQASSNFTMPYLNKLNGNNLVLGPIDDYIEAARRNRIYSRNFVDRIIWYFHERARKYYEKKITKKCMRVFFYSYEDLARFSKTVDGLGNARVTREPVVPNDGCDYNAKETREKEKSNKLVFVGGLGSAFNVDAVLHFCEEIYPLIKSMVAQVSFCIVGQNPPKKILELSKDSSITVTGTVPDVRPYIDEAAVYVAPIRAGTGFKTKIVEAMARGKAIVALPEGVQGLWDLGENAIRIAHDPESFAREVVSLLKNDTLRREIGFNARKLFEKSYTFEAVTPMILKEYDEIEMDLSRCKT